MSKTYIDVGLSFLSKPLALSDRIPFLLLLLLLFIFLFLQGTHCLTIVHPSPDLKTLLAPLHCDQRESRRQRMKP